MYSLLFASDINNGIGLDNKLPWSLPKDMKYFKELTTDTTVIYGRKTFESLNSVPLKNRNNIIVSSSLKETSTFNSYIVNSIKSAFHVAIGLNKKIFVIGGSSLIKSFYKEYPNQCEFIYKTFINYDYKCDTKLIVDNINMKKVVIKNETDYDPIMNKDINLSFIRYEPITSEFQYINLLSDILQTGEKRMDRTETGTISKFGKQLEFDLTDGFPLLTTRKVYWKGVVEELLWMLRGETDSKILENKNVNIWKGNTSKSFISNLGLNIPEGDIGKGYGHQWRNFGGSKYYPYYNYLEHSNKKTFSDAYNSHFDNKYEPCTIIQTRDTNKYSDAYLSAMNMKEEKDGVDQIKEVIHLLKNDPYSRRIRFTGWNPIDLKKTVLPACHCSCDFYVRDKKYLDAKVFQRSCDVFLGAPFNIASYSLLIMIFCKMFNLHAGKLYYSLGDSHIYNNHIEQASKLITRSLRKLPNVKVSKIFKGTTVDTLLTELESLNLSDFELLNYNPHPVIKGEMAI